MKAKKDKKSRKIYQPPKLVEYGTVQGMTKNLMGSFNDAGAGGAMKPMA